MGKYMKHCGNQYFYSIIPIHGRVELGRQTENLRKQFYFLSNLLEVTRLVFTQLADRNPFLNTRSLSCINQIYLSLRKAPPYVGSPGFYPHKRVETHNPAVLPTDFPDSYYPGGSLPFSRWSFNTNHTLARHELSPAETFRPESTFTERDPPRTNTPSFHWQKTEHCRGSTFTVKLLEKSWR